MLVLCAVHGEELECVRSLGHLLVEFEKKDFEQCINLPASVSLSVKYKELTLLAGVVMRIKCSEDYLLLQYKFLEHKEFFCFYSSYPIGVPKIGFHKIRKSMYSNKYNAHSTE